MNELLVVKIPQLDALPREILAGFFLQLCNQPI